MEYSDWFRYLHGHTGATRLSCWNIYHYHITNSDPYINGNGYYTELRNGIKLRVFLKLKAQSSKVKKGAEV
jgi:hypothetical protein